MNEGLPYKSKNCIPHLYTSPLLNPGKSLITVSFAASIFGRYPCVDINALHSGITVPSGVFIAVVKLSINLKSTNLPEPPNVIPS